VSLSFHRVAASRLVAKRFFVISPSAIERRNLDLLDTPQRPRRIARRSEELSLIK
jgi:hypothetical protein